MLCLYKIKILVYNDDNNIMLIFNYMLKNGFVFFLLKLNMILIRKEDMK